jgi:hypothetical protein
LTVDSEECHRVTSLTQPVSRPSCELGTCKHASRTLTTVPRRRVDCVQLQSGNTTWENTQLHRTGTQEKVLRIERRMCERHPDTKAMLLIRTVPLAYCLEDTQIRKLRAWLRFQKGKTEQPGLEVMLWSCVREVLCANFRQHTGYPDWGFSWFSSLHPEKCRDSILIRPQQFPYKFFPIHLSSHHPTVYSLYTEKRL